MRGAWEVFQKNCDFHVSTTGADPEGPLFFFLADTIIMTRALFRSPATFHGPHKAADTGWATDYVGFRRAGAGRHRGTGGSRADQKAPKTGVHDGLVREPHYGAHFSGGQNTIKYHVFQLSGETFHRARDIPSRGASRETQCIARETFHRAERRERRSGHRSAAQLESRKSGKTNFYVEN